MLFFHVSLKILNMVRNFTMAVDIYSEVTLKFKSE